jgi:hypothetical protein
MKSSTGYLSDGGFVDAVKIFDDVIGCRHVLADNCRSMKRRDARKVVDAWPNTVK